MHVNSRIRVRQREDKENKDEDKKEQGAKTETRQASTAAMSDRKGIKTHCAAADERSRPGCTRDAALLSISLANRTTSKLAKCP